MKKIIILFLIALSLTTFTAPDSVKLEYNFKDNPYEAFQMVTETKSDFKMFGIDQKTSSKMILNIHREVSEADKSGTYRIKNVVDSGKIIIGGKESKYSGENNTSTVIMDKTGKILEHIGENQQRELQVNFPDKKVKIGDFWGSQMDMDVSDIAEKAGSVKLQMTFMFKGFESYSGYDCAVIESRFLSEDLDERKLKINIKGNGKIYFAYKEGRMIANFNKLKISFNVRSDQNDAGQLRTIFGIDLDMLTQLKAL